MFVNDFSERLEKLDREHSHSIESIEFRRNDSIPVTSTGGVPLKVYVFFRPNTSQGYAQQMMNKGVNIMYQQESDHFDVSTKPTVLVSKMEGETYAGRIETIGISRHPAQLYESIACIFLFLVLFAIWSRYKNDLPPGRLLGIFLIWCFGLRFLFEYLKEVQVPFENDLLLKSGLNMGQILSIPLILAGIVILVLSYRKKA